MLVFRGERGVAITELADKSADLRLPRHVARFWAWVRTPLIAEPSADIADALLDVQLERSLREIPVLNAIGIFYTLVVMTAATSATTPFYEYIYPGIGVLFCLYQVVVWQQRQHRTISHSEIPALLRNASLWGLGLAMMASLWSVRALFVDHFANREFIPVFITLGVLASAHCFASLPKSATAVLGVGILPCATTLVFLGEPVSLMLAVSSIAAGMLHMRLLLAQHTQTLTLLALKQRSYQLAYEDALTEIPNRRSVMEAAHAALARGTPFAIAVLDLDGFKQINDRLGHTAGDAVLRLVAKRLNVACRACDSIGRMGGDEFALLFRDIGQPSDVFARATQMHTSVCAPTGMDDLPVDIAASFGCAQFPRDGTTIAELLIAADKALYAAKAARKSRAAPRLATVWN